MCIRDSFCVSLGIPVTIYGHSTDYRGVALYSYAEFDSVDENDRYRLMDMMNRNGNRDGAALRFVAEHLAKRPENRKLLILISDGQPADTGYRGTEAEAVSYTHLDVYRRQPYHSLSLASLYRISPGSALSPFQLDPWYGG